MWRHDCTCNVCVWGRGGVSWYLVRRKSGIPRTEDEIQFPNSRVLLDPDCTETSVTVWDGSSNLGRSWGALDAWTFAHTLGYPGKLLQSELREETCGLLSSGSSKPQARLPVRSAPSEEPREDPPLLPQLPAAPSLKLTADGTCADPSLKALSHPLSIFYTISFSLIR